MPKSLQASAQPTLFSKSYNLQGASYQVGTDIGGSGTVLGNPRLPYLAIVLFYPKQLALTMIRFQYTFSSVLNMLSPVDYLLYSPLKYMDYYM